MLNKELVHEIPGPSIIHAPIDHKVEKDVAAKYQVTINTASTSKPNTDSGLQNEAVAKEDVAPSSKTEVIHQNVVVANLLPIDEGGGFCNTSLMTWLAWNIWGINKRYKQKELSAYIRENHIKVVVWWKLE